MRKVKESGYVSIRKQGYFFSEAFGGKTIAVKKSSKGHHLINIYFRQFKIGQIILFYSLEIFLLAVQSVLYRHWHYNSHKDIRDYLNEQEVLNPKR